MRTILAIDFQQDKLTLLETIIKNNLPNCRVVTSLSAKNGLEITRKKLPETILLDMSSPEMDGYEICLKLKRTNCWLS